jgi:hypothetical protein
MVHNPVFPYVQGVAFVGHPPVVCPLPGNAVVAVPSQIATGDHNIPTERI